MKGESLRTSRDGALLSKELFSRPLLSRRVLSTVSLEKEKVDILKSQWKELWQERISDKVRAEGIASLSYPNLFVDKGTIIHATRDFRALNFKEILERHQIINADRFIPASPSVGGWGLFIKKSIGGIDTAKNVRNRRATVYRTEYVGRKARQQPKKCGRGWLHT